MNAIKSNKQIKPTLPPPSSPKSWSSHTPMIGMPVSIRACQDDLLIWGMLRNLVSFVQFEKREKHP